MLAARGGSLDLVELLLARGAQPNMKNETGTTALLVAARHNRPAIAQALLRRGAMINATDRQGWTALMYAASLGHGVTVRTLLNSGADPRLVNKEGWTASMYAAQGQRAAVDPSQTAFNISDHRNRFGHQHQRMVGEQDFGEILALLKQAEEKPYSHRHRTARSSIARF
jgi:ankyrin repeat protein